jgi:hypothetical protein
VGGRRRGAARVSDTIRIGPFRLGGAGTLSRRPRPAAWITIRTPLGRVTVSRRITWKK